MTNTEHPTPQFTSAQLAEHLRDWHQANLPLFGDTGRNPVGWQALADSILAKNVLVPR